MNLQSINLRPLVVLASLALVLIAGAAALILAQGVSRQLDDVLETYQLRQYARELSLALAEAEVARRGYLLTLDKVHLPPFASALEQMEGSVGALYQRTANSPSQRARTDALLGRLETKRAELQASISLAEAGRIDEARAAFASASEDELTAEINRGIAEFVAREDQLLVERNAEVDRLRTSLLIAILAALAGAATLAYALFSSAQREVIDLAKSRFALISENEKLDARVQARTSELEEARAHADRERARVETMLRETNHRIGNSLATVSSLLALQQMRTQSQEVRDALDAARGRVHAIASAHRRLRLGDDFETMRADEFLDSVVEDLRSTQPKQEQVQFHTDFAPLVINARDATTLGIVVGELVTNALKHAFPESRAGNLAVRLLADSAGIAQLVVEDDGVGIKADAEAGRGLGQVIVNQLAMQFGGKPQIAPGRTGGTCVTIPMPLLTGDRTPDQASHQKGREP